MEKDIRKMNQKEFDKHWLEKEKENVKDEQCLYEILQTAQQMIDDKQYSRLYCYLLEFDRLVKRSLHQSGKKVNTDHPFWMVHTPIMKMED